MNRYKGLISYNAALIMSVLLVVISMVWGGWVEHVPGVSVTANRISRSLERKYAEMSVVAAQFKTDKLRTGRPFNRYNELGINAQKQDIQVYIIENSNLIYWNSVRYDNIKYLLSCKNGVQEQKGNLFLLLSDSIDSKHIVIVSDIYQHSSVNNDYLKSAFASWLGVDKHYLFASDSKDNSGNVFFYNEPIFSVAQSSDNGWFKYKNVLPSLLLIMGLFFIAALVLNRILYARFNLKLNLLFAVSLILLILIVVVFKQPKWLFKSELFSPNLFSYSGIVDSPGNLLIFTLLYLIVIQVFIRWLKNVKVSGDWFFSGLVFVCILLFVFISQSFNAIQTNSTVSFEIYKVNLIDGYTILLILTFLTLFGAWFVLMLTIIRKCVDTFSLNIFLIIIALTGIFLLLVFRLEIFSSVLEYAIGAFGFIAVAIVTMKYYDHSFGYIVFFSNVLLFTLMLTTIIWRGGIAKDKSRVKTMLVNLSVGVLSERDPEIEVELRAIDPQLSSDAILIEMLKSGPVNLGQLNRYLRNTYFGNQLSEYEMQTVVCKPSDDLFLSHEGGKVVCYPYFNEMLKREGELISDSLFWFLDNKNGRISYFCKLNLFRDTPLELTLYIDLESKILSRGTGFPELISDKAFLNSQAYKGYSFARYDSSRLVTYYGNYSYNSGVEWFNGFVGEYFSFNHSGYDHYGYRSSADDVVILSTPERKSFHFVLLFAFLFVLIFSVASIGRYFLFLRIGGSDTRFSLSFRIRIFVITTLIVSFVLTGAAAIYFNIRQENQKIRGVLSENVNTIITRLEQLLGEAESLSDMDVPWLEEELKTLSNMFNFDVHIYGLNGQLVTSSRMAIFNENIQGKYIQPNAYYQLTAGQRMMVWQSESIGSFRYLSYYHTLHSWNNQLLGYLNVPFFSGTSQLSDTITSFVVLLIDIYVVFVLLVILFIVIFSQNIIRPLLELKERLAQIRLTGQNQKIEYNGDDEISDLVVQFNQMVDELALSAEMLSRNQRDMAWREMARQIAHEIKNPLTPMKLSVQHLIRLKKYDREAFDKVFSNTSEMLIEQIDNLSRIASEFSAFSKVVEPKIARIDVVETMSLCGQLFKKQEFRDVSIVINTHGPLYAGFDKEHLVQILNNLIKNAVQACENIEHPYIELSANSDEKQLKIIIKDNGPGIPEALKSRIFEPNFTTKNSGMGLGLAIVKRLLSNVGCDIGFRSEPGETVFEFTLPLWKTES